jgi:predicted DNA-binding antitoxin AbrB/MazE fold protein
MSNYSKPLNRIDFKNGEKPDEVREEEKFMYKYLEQRDVKKSTKKEGDEVESEASENSEEERFATA